MNESLVLEPRSLDSDFVQMHHPRIPSQPVRLQMWEKLRYQNWSATGWRQLSGAAESESWQTGSDGTLQRTLRSIDGVNAQLQLQPRPDALLVTITATNITREIADPFWGTFPIQDLWADLCVHFRDADLFYDPEFSRVAISVNGAATPLEETDLSSTYQACLPGYWPLTGGTRVRVLPETLNNYGAAMSTTTTDNSWIAVTSRDRAWTLLTAYPRVYNLWANRREPMHGCIHANALIGDLPVDGTASISGIIMLAPRPLAQVLSEAQRWMQAGL